MITGAQIRAARGLLNMSVAELSEVTGLAINTIRRAEGTNDVPAVTPANLQLLATIFEAKGIEFIPAAEKGPGVRFSSAEISGLQNRRRSKF